MAASRRLWDGEEKEEKRGRILTNRHSSSVKFRGKKTHSGRERRGGLKKPKAS